MSVYIIGQLTFCSLLVMHHCLQELLRAILDYFWIPLFPLYFVLAQSHRCHVILKISVQLKWFTQLVFKVNFRKNANLFRPCSQLEFLVDRIHWSFNLTSPKLLKFLQGDQYLIADHCGEYIVNLVFPTWFCCEFSVLRDLEFVHCVCVKLVKGKSDDFTLVV